MPTLQFHASHVPAANPSAVIVGTPPAFRGGVSEGRHLELDLLKYFPTVGYFIEKPVSTAPIDEVKQVAADLVQNKNVVSVGYMLRYLRCVQKMKQIIHDNNLTVMATNARYVSGARWDVGVGGWILYSASPADSSSLILR